MNKKELKDSVYNKIEKFVDLIDLNYTPAVLDARANVIDSLIKVYRTLDEEIKREENKI